MFLLTILKGTTVSSYNYTILYLFLSLETYYLLFSTIIITNGVNNFPHTSLCTSGISWRVAFYFQFSLLSDGAPLPPHNITHITTLAPLVIFLHWTGKIMYFTCLLGFLFRVFFHCSNLPLLQCKKLQEPDIWVCLLVHCYIYPWYL